MGRRLPILLACVALAPLAGCGGGDDPNQSGSVPAAGENTPPAGTPGVPDGAAYDVDGFRWRKLTRAQAFAAAREYIADNPEICEGAEVDAVSFYVTNSYGTDFPLDIAAADLLSEGCAASLQS